MVKALKGKKISPKISVCDKDNIHFAVSCRHCEDAICVKSCIAGALHYENSVVVIDKTKCVGCLTCVLVCPYGAVSIVGDDASSHAEINVALCKGCGTCVGACPSGAMDQQHFKTDQIMAQISAALEDVGK